MNTNKEVRLPQVVEDRLQDAYDIIRNKETKQMKKYKHGYKRWIGAAAAVMLAVAIPSAVYAAVSYFQKNIQEDADRLTYEFQLNYDLVPGEYQVTANYLPDGMKDTGSNQYSGQEDDTWITVMPVYTMSELEKINGQIVVEHIEQVEHPRVNGMEADLITFQEAEKYRSATWLFLFNEHDGYMLDIRAGYAVPRDELMKFAEALHIERIGDGSYETAEDKALREKEAAAAALQAQDAAGTWETLMQLGIPQEKIHPLGEELRTCDGAYGYRVTGYEFLDSIEGFAAEGFFDYTRFDGWLNADRTLRPYTRQHYDKNGQLLAEEETEQEILRVDMEACCYDGQWSTDVPLDFSLAYIVQNPDGSCTWAEDSYDAVPAEDYALQMDDSAVYINKAIHTQGEDRKDFFFTDLNKGETLQYTLLFVVDRDRRNDFLLEPTGANTSLWQGESMTAQEILEELEGYIRLQ